MHERSVEAEDLSDCLGLSPLRPAETNENHISCEEMLLVGIGASAAAGAALVLPLLLYYHFVDRKKSTLVTGLTFCCTLTSALLLALLVPIDIMQASTANSDSMQVPEEPRAVQAPSVAEAAAAAHAANASSAFTPAGAAAAAAAAAGWAALRSATLPLTADLLQRIYLFLGVAVFVCCFLLTPAAVFYANERNRRCAQDVDEDDSLPCEALFVALRKTGFFVLALCAVLLLLLALRPGMPSPAFLRPEKTALPPVAPEQQQLRPPNPEGTSPAAQVVWIVFGAFGLATLPFAWLYRGLSTQQKQRQVQHEIATLREQQRQLQRKYAGGLHEMRPEDSEALEKLRVQQRLCSERNYKLQYPPTDLWLVCCWLLLLLLGGLYGLLELLPRCKLRRTGMRELQQHMSVKGGRSSPQAAPQYASFGNQTFVPQNGSDAITCTLHAAAAGTSCHLTIFAAALSQVAFVCIILCLAYAAICKRAAPHLGDPWDSQQLRKAAEDLEDMAILDESASLIGT
ncbi:hypothetical protein, conserved [Eimeria necatrix]|uniref:Uncharacterized protein n=1 Tax=Eimeria necatrix TaxID=51315 RepID=U6N0W7_9EIME|nr:hypothetical protein, conserved [Eimeria necatrix]CDJ67555.1 hypothetical protein, conserved [Eimeria necatrix]